MAANPHRATIVVNLNGVEHDVCLTNAALAEIEAELNANSLDLLPRSSGERLKVGIREAYAIIHAGLRGAGKKVQRAAVVDLLEGMHPGAIVAAAYRALGAAFEDPEPNPPQEGESPSIESPGAS